MSWVTRGLLAAFIIALSVVLGLTRGWMVGWMVLVCSLLGL